MKIAGRKNDGAWFRTNKAISKLTVPQRADFIAALKEATGAKAASVVADLTALAAECGVGVPANLATADAWLTSLGTTGIPRQIWFGKLTFTTYGKNGTQYVPNYQTNVRYFAKDLRKFCKFWLIGARELADVSNEPVVFNPGGLPNAGPG